MGIAGKYFWVMALVVSILNYYMAHSRTKKHIQEAPELAESYAMLIRNCTFGMLFPFLIMGLGCTFGDLTIDHFFRPRDGNPYVLAFMASVVMLWILSIYWIFFKDGAATLEKHYMLLNPRTMSATSIKFYFLVSILGGVIALIAMWVIDIPLSPDIR